MSEVFGRYGEQVSLELCDIMSGMGNQDAVAASIFRSNIGKYIFRITGRYSKTTEENCEEIIVPEIEYTEERFDGSDEDFMVYIYEEINAYISNICENPTLFARTRPWMKPYDEFHDQNFDEYMLDPSLIEGYSQTGSSSELLFYGIRVRLIPVSFTSEMVIPKEFYFLHTYHHQYIMPAFGIIRNIDDTGLLVAGFCETTLEQYVLQESIGEEKKLELMLQIVKVVWHLHTKNIVVFSISPQDIYIERENGVEIRICNFTDSEIIGENTEGKVNEHECTSIYSPRDRIVDLKNDIYSLGLVYYFIWTGTEYHFENESLLADDFLHYIRSMTTEDLTARLSSQQVYEFLISLKGRPE